MEIDIRKAKEDERVASIRYSDNGIIRNLDHNSCVIPYGEIQIKDIDNLILALKKYKEIYGEKT